MKVEILTQNPVSLSQSYQQLFHLFNYWSMTRFTSSGVINVHSAHDIQNVSVVGH